MQSLKLRSDDNPGEAQFDGAARELGDCCRRIESGNMCKPNEAARIVAFRLSHTVVDRRQVAKSG